VHFAPVRPQEMAQAPGGVVVMGMRGLVVGEGGGGCGDVAGRYGVGRHAGDTLCDVSDRMKSSLVQKA
jgi:hypothetical protein